MTQMEINFLAGLVVNITEEVKRSQILQKLLKK